MARKKQPVRSLEAFPVVPFVKHVDGEPRVGLCVLGRFFDPFGLVAGHQVLVSTSPAYMWSDDDGKTWRGLGQGRPI